MTLNNAQKAGIFKQLTTKTFYDVGIQYSFDKHYKTNAGIKGAVYNIYRKILANPEEYLISQDTVELVSKAVSERSITHTSGTKTIAEKQDVDIKTLILSNRDIANKLINKKLVSLDKSSKALKGESLVTLGKIFGILFDKSQIIQGQATEHVALMGKIDSGLSPEDKLDMILKMREITVAQKND